MADKIGLLEKLSSDIGYVLSDRQMDQFNHIRSESAEWIFHINWKILRALWTFSFI